MIKVVIATNVVISATLVNQGPSAGILDLATNKKLQMFDRVVPLLAQGQQ